MRLAVLSDIHGNYIALQKCMSYIETQGIDTLILLGDYIGELAYPQSTMELLYQLQERYHCIFIRGNKEEYWLDYRTKGVHWAQNCESTIGILRYAYENLTDRDLNFFEGMETTREMVIDQLPKIVICHGSPERINEDLTPDRENSFASIRRCKADYILCGHTHVQSIFTVDQKTVWNPGTVGLPYHSNGKTQFMLLNGKGKSWQTELVSLPYDADRVIADMQEERLFERAPYWSKITEIALRTSEISHTHILLRAMELCKLESGICRWPQIPEIYWKRAFEEFEKLS